MKLVVINLSLSEILLTNYYFSLRHISLKNSEILCEHYVVREIAFINNLLLLKKIIFICTNVQNCTYTILIHRYITYKLVTDKFL